MNKTLNYPQPPTVKDQTSQLKSKEERDGMILETTLSTFFPTGLSERAPEYYFHVDRSLFSLHSMNHGN